MFYLLFLQYNILNYMHSLMPELWPLANALKPIVGILMELLKTLESFGNEEVC